MTLAYVLAWLPFVAMYVVVFRMMGLGPLDAATGAFANALPEAVLGIVPLRYAITSSSARSGPPQRATLLARHASFALLFVIAATLGKVALLMAHRATEHVGWVYAPFDLARRAALDSFLALRQVFLGRGTGGPYDPGILVWQAFIALLVYVVLASVGSVVGAQLRLRAEEARASRAETLRARAEAQALRSQLNPHFLFNTLHSLLSLVRREPDRAERALEQFGDLMRYSLRVHANGSDEVRLRDEWEFVETYLDLERLRLGDRLNVTRRLDPRAADEVVPAFCLQPLVENAIRHAVATRAAPTHLGVDARRVNGTLVLEVVDDGPGVTRAGGAEMGSGLGLRLVRERLRSMFGESARLDVHSAPGKGFRATIQVQVSGRDAELA